MDKVRVGLIGAGSIGVRHMKAMEEVPEITLVAIARTLSSGGQDWSSAEYSHIPRCWRDVGAGRS